MKTGQTTPGIPGPPISLLQLQVERAIEHDYSSYSSNSSVLLFIPPGGPAHRAFCCPLPPLLPRNSKLRSALLKLPHPDVDVARCGRSGRRSGSRPGGAGTWPRSSGRSSGPSASRACPRRFVFTHVAFALTRPLGTSLQRKKERKKERKKMHSLAWEQCSDEGACLVPVHDV